MTAVKDECSDHKASWTAQLLFRGLFCFSPNEELDQQFAEVDLFEYTKAVYKGPSNIIIRFDPNDYPVTANAWSGGGAKALIADLQQAAKASHTDLISKGEYGGLKGSRQLCCRGHKSCSFNETSTCTKSCRKALCPVKLAICYDDKSFYMKCGRGSSDHQCIPPIRTPEDSRSYRTESDASDEKKEDCSGSHGVREKLQPLLEEIVQTTDAINEEKNTHAVEGSLRRIAEDQKAHLATKRKRKTKSLEDKNHGRKNGEDALELLSRMASEAT